MGRIQRTPEHSAIRAWWLTVATVDAKAVTALYRSGHEFALIDSREQWDFCRGHALIASSCPLSSAELVVEDLIPRKASRVIVMDEDSEAGSARSRRALQRLEELGYSDLCVLEGGTRGWQAAGYRLFSGIHVYSKLFGEYVEHRFASREIEAAELAVALRSPSPPMTLDVRPGAEFRQATVPGALNVPADTLLRAVPALARDATTPIVVHCGGRTRGIIAAQTLALAGVPNPVAVLTNGTMGWRLAGFDTLAGDEHPPLIADYTVEHSRRYARALFDRTTIRRIGATELAQTLEEGAEITTYLIDVRSSWEYEAAHHPLARHAAAGQLLQELDAVIGVRNSRVVLLDDIGDRAAYAGYWLQRAGWRDVRWFSYADYRGPLTCGRWRRPDSSGMLSEACRYLSTLELHQLMQHGRAIVMDVSASVEYERGRIPGALFAIRSRLPEGLEPKLPEGKLLVLTCEDGRRARLAGLDLREQYGDRVRALLGGNRAWRSAGMVLEEGPGSFLHAPNDVRRSIYHRPTDLLGAMRGYLDWEVSLWDDAQGEDYLRFDF